METLKYYPMRQTISHDKFFSLFTIRIIPYHTKWLATNKNLRKDTIIFSHTLFTFRMLLKEDTGLKEIFVVGQLSLKPRVQKQLTFRDIRFIFMRL